MDCIFCKIIRNEIPSYKIYEDNNSIAILDIFPIRRGQAVLISKDHMASNFSSVSEDIIKELIISAQLVSKNLEKKLGYGRSFVVIQGLGVDHFHIKIYPNYATDTEKLTLMLGEKAKDSELKEIMEIINQ